MITLTFGSFEIKMFSLNAFVVGFELRKLSVSFIQCYSEELYEDEQFRYRKLCALVASKVRIVYF